MAEKVWKRCIGMNRNEKCVAPAGMHMGHRKVLGVWYGQVPQKTVPKDKIRKKKWWK